MDIEALMSRALDTKNMCTGMVENAIKFVLGAKYDRNTLKNIIDVYNIDLADDKEISNTINIIARLVGEFSYYQTRMLAGLHPFEFNSVLMIAHALKAECAILERQTKEAKSE